MLALASYRLAHCPHCQGNLAETTNPNNEEGYKTTTARCFKCTALAISMAALNVPGVTAPHAILHMAELRT